VAGEVPLRAALPAGLELGLDYAHVPQPIVELFRGKRVDLILPIAVKVAQ